MATMKPTLISSKLPDILVRAIADRSATLWLHRTPTGAQQELLARFIGLPWREVYVSSLLSQDLVDALERESDPDLVRRRGFAQVIASNPASVLLPPRCLPIYLLDGDGRQESAFDRNLRKMS